MEKILEEIEIDEDGIGRKKDGTLVEKVIPVGKPMLIRGDADSLKDPKYVYASLIGNFPYHILVEQVKYYAIGGTRNYLRKREHFIPEEDDGAVQLYKPKTAMNKK